MVIGVLSVQGGFIEHEKALNKLGACCIELRKKEDLENHLDGLVLPGGESTVQGKLLRELGMFDILKKQIQNGMPVLATCAGLILLSKSISGESEAHFGTLPVKIKRNAYGRQLGSFYTEGEVKGIGVVPMTFIRAPYIESADKDVKILAKENDHIVAVQYENQIGCAFHPELNEDQKIHEYFLNIVKKHSSSAK